MNKIQELRLAKGWTKSDLSRIMNTSQTTIANWENEVTVPRKEKIEQLSNVFKVSVPFILGYEKAVSNDCAVDQKIKQIRLNKGMTLEEFGELFSTSKGTVNNWEKGRNLPNKENLLKIAQLANTTVEELTRNSDLVTLTQIEFARLKEIERKYNEIKGLVDD